MEKEPQQIPLNIDPNVYAITNVALVHDEESFHFIVDSGIQRRQFTVTPKHAKRIYLLLKQQIETYEKQFHELKTELPKAPKQTQEETKMGF